MFEANRKEWRALAMGDQRVQISSTRYRIPDPCVIRSTDPDDNIVIVPPLLCVEILSKGDSLGQLQERVDDYVSMGVENIWAIDPWKRRAYVAFKGRYEEPQDGVLRIDNTLIRVVLKDLFAALDEF